MNAQRLHVHLKWISHFIEVWHTVTVAKHSREFAVLHWQRWRLHISEIFSRGTNTINKEINKYILLCPFPYSKIKGNQWSLQGVGSGVGVLPLSAKKCKNYYNLLFILKEIWYFLKPFLFIIIIFVYIISSMHALC